MANVTIQARINPQLRDAANAVFTAMGLTTADAIRMFLQQSVNIGGLPFQPKANQPNLLTKQAMAELENGNSKTFDTVDELFDELDEE